MQIVLILRTSAY